LNEFLLIAHRGASGCWPENTLLAFRKALEAGARWLELDVHLSSDGELVVIHDETLQRTTDGAGRVADVSLSQLQLLDAGQGERIPLLEEVLDLAQGKAGVNIELKGTATGAAVARLLLRRKIAAGREKILASSLYERELREFAALLPQQPLALVAERPSRSLWALAEELDLWSLNLEKSCIDERLIEKAREHKRRVLVFTVNDITEVARLRKLGVDGIFTDYPECFNRGVRSFHQ